MYEEIREVQMVIDLLNDEMYDNLENKDSLNDLPQFSITIIDSLWSVDLLMNYSDINMPKIPIYESESDERIYYEKTDDYEEYEDLFRRKFKAVLKKLNNVKL